MRNPVEVLGRSWPLRKLASAFEWLAHDIIARLPAWVLLGLTATVAVACAVAATR